MDSKRKNNLDLFKRLSGRTNEPVCCIKAPVLVEPKMQYFGAGVKEYFK